MNKREVFDKVAKHLLDQGKRAIGPGGCRYKTNDGLSCAVGCLIPDELYNPLMEGNGINALVDRFPIMKKLFNDHLDLLKRLQGIHDHGLVEDWEDQLNWVRGTL